MWDNLSLHRNSKYSDGFGFRCQINTYENKLKKSFIEKLRLSLEKFTLLARFYFPIIHSVESEPC